MTATSTLLPFRSICVWLGDDRSVKDVQSGYDTGSVAALARRARSDFHNVDEYSSTGLDTCSAVV